jgi:hypothetical protein
MASKTCNAADRTDTEHPKGTIAVSDRRRAIFRQTAIETISRGMDATLT